LKCTGEIETYGAYLCENCWDILPLFPERWGEPFRSLRGVLDRLWVAWQYDDVIRRIVHLFKYSGRPDIAEVIVPFWLAALPSQKPIFDVDLLVPVPIHSARRRHRGFNQSEALAEKIAAIHHIPVDCTSIVRQVNTPSQTHLDRSERWKSVAGAFRVDHAENLKNQRILMIDDLATSGATLHALAEILHDCQVESVSAAVLTSPFSEGSST